eukprot:1917824-Amphidinium_carterae.1
MFCSAPEVACTIQCLQTFATPLTIGLDVYHAHLAHLPAKGSVVNNLINENAGTNPSSRDTWP